MRTKFIIATALCCLFSLSATAAPGTGKKQQPERAAMTHLLGGHLMAGYDNMLKLDSRLQNIGGPMGGLGFDYQLQYGTYSKGAFLLNAGLEAQYGLNIRKGTFDITRRLVNPSDEMFLGYQFRNLSERQTALDLSLSLMAGAKFQGLFFLAGVRMGSPVGAAGYTVQSDVNRVIYDARAIDYYASMPHHMLASDQVKSTGSLARRLSPFVALEAGYDFFRPSQQPMTKSRSKEQPKRTFKDYGHFRLSAFVNVGVADYKPAGTAPLVAFDDQLGVAQIQSTSHAAEFASARTIPIVAGQKFAVMCELPSKKPKQQAEPNPFIVTYVRDELTGKPVGGATVTTRAVSKGKKKKKPVVKTTDDKAGRVVRTFTPGDYTVSVSHPAYFPMEGYAFTHTDSNDTLRLAIYPQRPLRSQVVDDKTGRPVTAQVTVYDDKDNAILKASVDSIETLASTLVDGRKQYAVCVTAEGYRDTCTSVTDIAEVLVIRLEPIQVRKFVLRNLFFATDKTDILPSSDAALQELYSLLNDNPDIRIRIIGHTDDIGRDDYNLRLSKGRSESVKEEMVRRGIDAQRIETAGRGEQDPIVPNDTDEHRQMNRRVEIEILNSGSVNLRISDEQLTR